MVPIASKRRRALEYCQQEKIYAVHVRRKGGLWKIQGALSSAKQKRNQSPGSAELVGRNVQDQVAKLGKGANFKRLRESEKGDVEWQSNQVKCFDAVLVQLRLSFSNVVAQSEVRQGDLVKF